MPLNIEPLDRNQRTAFQEREALREKVNEIIETVTPMEITWDPAPTAGHGAGYQVTSEGVKQYTDSGDAALDIRIDSEQTARANADAALGTRIDDEESYRTAADATLSEQITAEQGARADADTALGTRIDSEQTTRQTADTNIRAQIAGEQVARADADTALGTRIDGKQDVLVSGTNIKTVGGNSLLGAGDIPISGGVQWDAVPTAGHGTGYAVTSEGVKNAVDGKQDTLVSGTNIKTVNGTSLLGAGDIDTHTERIVLKNTVISPTNLQGITDDQLITFRGTYTDGILTGYIEFTGYRIPPDTPSDTTLWFQGTGYHKRGGNDINFLFKINLFVQGGQTRILQFEFNEGTSDSISVDYDVTADIVYEGVSS